MNCCDYDCHQGRDCPARVAKAKPVMWAAAPLPESKLEYHLRVVCAWVLRAVAITLVACAVLVAALS
jgi:negative regulator of sigma E activity